MKKIATILMLVTAILLGGASVDAKTTKKKTKAKTSQSANKIESKEFSPSMLMGKGKYGIIVFKRGIGNALVNAGFKKEGLKFSKDGIVVKLDRSQPGAVEISFDNLRERDNFINETKELGFEWDGLDCINAYEKGYDISVYDNKIVITAFEC